MNRILISILLLGVALARAQDIDMMMGSGDEMEMVMLTVPMNIEVNVMSTSVFLTWDMVEGATGYQVTIENVTDQNAQESQIQIGGLIPQTTYTAMIKSTRDEEMSDAAEVTFTTLLAGVQNLKLVEATETEIEVMWEAVEGANSYTVVIESEVDGEETQIVTAETSARFTGLIATTFYMIYVTADSDEGSSDTADLSVRTDGSGVQIDGIWQNSPNDTFGGQILVLRPLQIPRGSYSVEVLISCPLVEVNVWNADINRELSDYSLGIIIVTQSQSWQRTKGEIGLNFQFEEGINCTFGTDLPTASFGIVVPGDEVAPETMDVPIVRNEWLNVPNFAVKTAGLVRVRLNQVFRSTNEVEEDSELPPKPAVYDSVIAINPGVECPGGIAAASAWSMTLKNVSGIVGTLPGVLYFVQEDTDWYSNEAGLIYGYNPEICPDRSEVNAEVMIGGDLVRAVVDAPMMEY